MKSISYETVAPRRIQVTTTAQNIPIRPDLYLTILNEPFDATYINFIGTAQAVRTGDNIRLVPGGKITNLPPSGLSVMSVITEHIDDQYILIFQSEKPIDIEWSMPDNATYFDSFNVTAANDNAFTVYTYATMVALGGRRIIAVIVEGVTNAGLVTVDGTTPARGPPEVGAHVAAGNSVTITCDSYVDISGINAAAGSNTNLRGFILAV